MKTEVLLLTLVIQTVVQMALYLSTAKFIYFFIKKGATMLSLSHNVFEMKRQEMANGIVAFMLIIYNIALSLLVLKFTSTGALSGITNLGASVLVGCVMTIHFKEGGKYYIKVEERKSLLKRAQEYVKSIKNKKKNKLGS